MKVSELMQNVTLDPTYEGPLTNDDIVLAVNTSASAETAVGDYAVVQDYIKGVDGQMNPITQDSQYIRSGQSTMKTGDQRTFKVTGDAYVGDDFQDYALSHEVKYGTGETVITDYVKFNLYNGKGEKGKVSIIVNSDGSGNAGENAGIDIDLRKVGGKPEEFTYTTT